MTTQFSETAAQSSPATPAPADARGPHLRGVSGGKLSDLIAAEYACQRRYVLTKGTKEASHHTWRKWVMAKAALAAATPAP